MPVEIGGIILNRIHKISTLENADFASHRLPGLDGDIVQNMGRHSVRLCIEGIYYGDEAQDNLETLRDLYKAREPVDFLAEIIGQAYFSQVVLERFEVRQAAQEPNQFSYLLDIKEYVPPPEPESGLDLPGLDDAIGLDALDFMGALELPDLLSLPELTNPTEPLGTVLDGVGSTLDSLMGPATDLNGLFGGGGDGKAVRAPGEGSLSVDVSVALDENQVLAFIEEQLGHLTGAGEVLKNLFDNPPGEIGDIGDFLGDLSLPEDGLSGVLENGFGAIGELIPSDVSDLTGNLTLGIGDFFVNLNTNLTTKISQIFEAYKAIKELIEFDFSIEIETTDGSDTSRAVRDPDSPFLDAIARLEELKDFLDILPNPMTVANLLAFMDRGLSQIERDAIPIRYLPILDELRDKLQTVVAWHDMTPVQLETHLAETIQKLADNIETHFKTNASDAITAHANTLLGEIQAVGLSSNITNVKQLLTDLKTAVEIGDLSTSQANINALQTNKDQLETLLQNIEEQVQDGQDDALVFRVSDYHNRMESELLQLLSDLCPPSDLPILAHVINPVGALDESALDEVKEAIKGTLGKVTGFIEQFNLSGISDTLSDVVGGATGAVDELRNMMLQATVELTLILDQVENAIDGLNVEGLVQDLENALKNFIQTIQNGVDVVFGPVRNVLQNTLSTIDGFIKQFNPAQFIEQLQAIIQNLTDLLTNPQLLNTIDELRNILNSINGELGQFSFKPVTNIVVDAIGLVEEALNLALKIPMPDSLKEDFKNALKQLPKEIETDGIVIELGNIIDQGPKPVLEEIRDKPAELVALLEGFSPGEYIGQYLTEPYQEFLGQMEQYKPSSLLEPLQEKLDELKTEISETIDPVKLMEPLNEPYQQLLGLFDQFDPQELVAPLQEAMSEGIQTITESLPLDEANEVFDEVAEINNKIAMVVQMGITIRDLLQDIQSRVSGLEDAETQARNFGQLIADKIDQLSDINQISSSLSALEAAIDLTKVSNLTTPVSNTVNNVISVLETLAPQQNLVELISAHRTFPMAALSALPDSPEKTALVNLLNAFDPLDEVYSIPLQKLENWKTALQDAQGEMLPNFSDWDQLYHGANSPLNDLKMAGTTLAQVKTLLATTVEQQLTGVIAPLFKLVEIVQGLANTLLEELTDLIDELQSQLAELVKIGDSFELLRISINQLVETLNNFDITFIADEIQDIFDALKSKVEAIDPAKLAAILKTTFDDLLATLDLNELFGVDVLDAQYQGLVDYLKNNDPTKVLADAAQEEYNKIVDFIKLFDFSIPINTFLEIIAKLRLELQTELDRTEVAYADMIAVIPSEFSASIGIEVSATVEV